MDSFEPLIHIGYHKTASSWLQQSFFNNRELGFYQACPRSLLVKYLVKPHVFDFQPNEARTKILSHVQTHEGPHTPVLSHERLSGAIFSGGYDCLTLADRINETFPEAKILIFIREQRSMILSIYKQYVETGGTMTLSDFLNPKIPENDQRRPLFRPEYLLYDRLIDYYYNLFGNDRVRVVPFEYFKQELKKCLSEVIEFAVPEPHRPDNEKPLEEVCEKGKRNRSMSWTGVMFKRLLNPLLINNSINLYPHFYVAGTNKLYKKVFTTLSAYDPLDDLVDRRKLRTINRFVIQNDHDFKTSNQRTGSLTEFNLKEFDYLT